MMALLGAPQHSLRTYNPERITLRADTTLWRFNLEASEIQSNSRRRSAAIARS
jgi:hypothetical protein